MEFLTTGVVPIIILVLIALIMFPVIEAEGTAWAFAFVATAALLAQFLFGYDVWGAVAENPFKVVAFVVCYVAVGVGYAMWRWDMRCAKWRRDYDNPLTDKYIKQSMWNTRPTAVKHKSLITSWMAFWPWSATWWFLSDFIVDAYEWLYAKFAAVFERIAAKHLDGAVEPVKPDKK